jgi:glycerol-3-phosphate cytidylyltransferase
MNAINGLTDSRGSSAADTDVVGYVPGAWDMFHIGHLNLIKRARAQCDYLVVGVVTDEVLELAKNKRPVVPLAERLEVVRSMDLVDQAVTDLSSDKLVMWELLHFDLLFKGDDWKGTPSGDRLEATMNSVGVEVVYFPYTTRTSSTALRHQLAG